MSESATPDRTITKVLIANRGEIAVRVARACADAGIGSVAVYAEPDADALHVRGRRRGVRPRRLHPRRLLPRDRQAARGGAGGRRRRRAPRLRLPRRERRLRPGRDRRRAGLDRPAPAGHRRRSATRSRPATSPSAPAPRWSPARNDPVAGADEVDRVRPASTACRWRSRPPSAAAAAGSRSPARRDEVAELFDSAVREAVSAFGRGECFVERYLDRPRHVETQCLADAHGNVVVVSTRDCSLQRRHQKLVEEAPAPFLTDEQVRRALPVVQGDPARGRLRRRRHLRVPRRPGRHHLLPRGEHPPAGRAPGHRGGHRPRPRPRAAAHRRRASRSATTTPRSAATPSSSASTARTPAAGSCPRPARSPTFVAAVRPRRAARLRRRSRRRRRRRVRLDARQARRHRRHPAAGARALAPRARRSSSSRACRPCCPFHRAVVRDPAFAPAERRAVHGAHPLDRDRVRQHHRAVVRRRPGEAPRGRRAAARRRRGRRQAARGRAARRARRGAGGAAPRRRRKAPRRSAARAPGAAASGDALTSPDAGHDRQGRRRRRRRRSPRATWSSCSRR